MSSDDARGKLEQIVSLGAPFDAKGTHSERVLGLARDALALLSSPPAGAQGWSREAPKVPGWYWKRRLGTRPFIVEVPNGEIALTANDEWLGPLSPSSPAPVAGYPGAWRCGETGMVWHLAETYCKHRNTAHAEVHGCGFVKLVPSSHPAPVAPGIGEALEKYGQHLHECKLWPCSCGLDSALKLLGGKPPCPECKGTGTVAVVIEGHAASTARCPKCQPAPGTEGESLRAQERDTALSRSSEAEKLLEELSAAATPFLPKPPAAPPKEGYVWLPEPEWVRFRDALGDAAAFLAGEAKRG